MPTGRHVVFRSRRQRRQHDVVNIDFTVIRRVTIFVGESFAHLCCAADRRRGGGRCMLTEWGFGECGMVGSYFESIVLER